MRAGSLSNDDVTRLLRRHFVAVWTSTEGDPVAGASYAHEPDDPAPSCIRGNGEHNVQVLFLTPLGEIFHTLSGYLSPADLEEELEFARELFRAMLEAAPGTRREVLVGAHRRKLLELERREPEGPLGAWAKRRVLADHRFALEHPLLDRRQFSTEGMVGSARTFFGSARGSVPEGRIGEGPALPEPPPPGPSPRSGS